MHLAISMLIAGAAQAAPATTPTSNEACALLTFAEVRNVQKVAVKDTKPSERVAGGQRHASCVFATNDFAHSVSVTLTTATGGTGGVTEYWNRTFTKERDEEDRAPAGGRPERDESPLRRISGLGNDAVWTGDGKAGSLYVLVPGAVLRVSVGGVADVDERLRRSQKLADAALVRWESSRSGKVAPTQK